LDGNHISPAGTSKSTDVGATDDDALEAIYLESTAQSGPGPSQPVRPVDGALRKRTREELVHDLKTARASKEAQQTSRFRPLNASERERKKTKLISHERVVDTLPSQNTNEEALSARGLHPENEVDIFSGVEEYIGLRDDGEEDGPKQTPEKTGLAAESSKEYPRDAGWFKEEPVTASTLTSGQYLRSLDASQDIPQGVCSSKGENPVDDDGSENPPRLVPLASSSIRSISQFLENDKEMEKEGDRRVKRDKRKGRRAER
jgi:hypothetical protein